MQNNEGNNIEIKNKNKNEELPLDLIMNQSIIGDSQKDEILRMSKTINTKKIIEINENKLKKMFSKNTNLEKKLIKIQSFLRMKLVRIKFLKKRKRLNYRRNVINELIQTEELYVNDLNLIYQEIMIPVKEQKILTSEEYLKLFSNLESIYKFNETFCSELISKFSEFEIQKTKIGDVVEKVIPFFRFYFSYCNNFERSNNFLMKLRKDKSNQNFLQFIQPLENKSSLKNMDLSSYLIKPVQRLPKYVLLFKDLFKHTDDDHPDYENIKRALKMFLEINKENNQKMDNYLRNFKMFELQKQFESGKLIILDPKREFIEEQPLNLIFNNVSRSVICYFLSDMILVTEREGGGVNYKLVNHLTLGEFSTVKEIRNFKHFNHLIRVTGNETSLTFSADNSENKIQIINLISKLITKLKEKSEQKKNVFVKMGSTMEAFKGIISSKNLGIAVNIIGTEERNVADYTRHTVYIIEIELNSYTQKLFMTYSKLRKLQELVENKYKKLKIPYLPKQNWYMNKTKSKIIESRMILIENFLQILLQNDKVIKKPEKILEFLNLPIDFYEILPSKTLLKDNSSLKKKNSLNNLLCDSQKLSQKLRQGSSKKIESKSIANIKVKLINNETIEILIHRQMTVRDITEEIIKKINLTVGLDYKLFLESSTNIKNLDEDEFLYELINYKENGNEGKKKAQNLKISLGTRNSFWEKFKEKIVSYFKKPPNLLFKKQIFLKKEYEEKELKNDDVRLNLLTEQVLNEISNGKYFMEIKEYALFVGIFLFIKKGEYKSLKINEETEIKKIVANFAAKFFTDSLNEEDWKELYMMNWQKISEDINIKWKNPNKLKKNDTIEKINEDKKILCKFLLINEINNNPIYGVAMYWVEICHKTPEVIERKWPKFIYLGIRYNEILLISQRNQNIIKSYNYSEKLKIEKYHKSLVIKGVDEKSIKFKTYKGYEIYQLIQEYRRLISLEN